MDKGLIILLFFSLLVLTGCSNSGSTNFTSPKNISIEDFSSINNYTFTTTVYGNAEAKAKIMPSDIPWPNSHVLEISYTPFEYFEKSFEPFLHLTLGSVSQKNRWYGMKYFIFFINTSSPKLHLVLRLHDCSEKNGEVWESKLMFEGQNDGTFHRIRIPLSESDFNISLDDTLNMDNGRFDLDVICHVEFLFKTYEANVTNEISIAKVFLSKD